MIAGRQREQLLGYLLGALEEDEHRQIEAQLRHDPALRGELAHLRQCLEPLERAWHPVCPPPGLWQRACRFVEVAARVVPSGLNSELSLGQSRRRWSLRDLAAAAAVLIAAGLLLFPAVNRSRFQAAVTGCQSNLRQFGVALKHFAASQQGCFPQMPVEGNDATGGFYAVALHDYGLLTDTQIMICPAVASRHRQPIDLPQCRELRSATPADLAGLRRRMAGDYGYHLGYVADGRYLAVRDQNRATFAIMADSPSPALDGEPSGNHGRLGQDVLFEDGSVRFLRWEDLTHGCVLLGGPIFFNDENDVAPGKHSHDAVIVPASVRPIKWAR